MYTSAAVRRDFFFLAKTRGLFPMATEAAKATAMPDASMVTMRSIRTSFNRFANSSPIFRTNSVSI